jgi:hypothetical protein
MKLRFSMAGLVTLVGVATADGDVSGDAAASRYPRRVIDRVLTYPKGIFVAGADLTNFTRSFFDPALVRVLVGYGITDDFELNFAHYAFSTEDAGKGSIDAGLGYKLLRGAAGGKLEVIARAQTGYSLASEGLNPLLLGAHVQYNVTPDFCIITPGGHLSIALDGVAIGDPPTEVNPITFNLPVSVGYQATPTLYVQADTSLGSIEIKDSESVFFGADVTPLFVAGYLNAIPAVDVFAGVGSSNLTVPEGGEVGDTLYVTVGVRYYGGAL